MSVMNKNNFLVVQLQLNILHSIVKTMIEENIPVYVHS